MASPFADSLSAFLSVRLAPETWLLNCREGQTPCNGQEGERCGRSRGSGSSRTPWAPSLPCGPRAHVRSTCPDRGLGATDRRLRPVPSAQDAGLATQGTSLFWLPEGESSTRPRGHLPACSGAPSPASAGLERACLRKSVACTSGQGRGGLPPARGHRLCRGGGGWRWRSREPCESSGGPGAQVASPRPGHSPETRRRGARPCRSPGHRQEAAREVLQGPLPAVLGQETGDAEAKAPRRARPAAGAGTTERPSHPHPAARPRAGQRLAGASLQAGAGALARGPGVTVSDQQGRPCASMAAGCHCVSEPSNLRRVIL